MDFSKTRCSMCYRHFCCAAHKTDHQMKNHSKMFCIQQEVLVHLFQKRAEAVLHKSRKFQTNIKNYNEKEENIKNVNITEYKLGMKRVYNEVNKQILPSSTSASSQTRKILVPVHRHEIKTFSKGSTEGKPEAKRDSPFDCKEVKTSTPINNDTNNQMTSQSHWSTSPASSMSSYSTPQECLTDNKLGFVKLPSNKGLSVTTPLRSIMSKISKYECDSEAGPSPTTKSRRVTFSFSSIVSSTNSSPLESVQEVEIKEEMQDEKCYVIDSSSQVIEYSVEQSKTDCKNNQHYIEDSPSIKESGFFSCVTNIFCSAMHTLPSLTSWHPSQNVSSNRLKRSRSPENKETLMEVITSPVHKRARYPYLWQSPIKSRRPISKF